jgi:hypothetical protein
MDLRMAVVACRNTIVRPGGLDLLVFNAPESQPLFFVARLQGASPAAAAIIIGPVRVHVDEILFTDHSLHHVPQILRNGIPEAFAHDLARILDGELEFQILVPVAVYLQFPFTDPLCVVFVDIFNNKIMRDVEFFQSCQD